MDFIKANRFIYTSPRLVNSLVLTVRNYHAKTKVSALGQTGRARKSVSLPCPIVFLRHVIYSIVYGNIEFRNMEI